MKRYHSPISFSLYSSIWIRNEEKLWVHQQFVWPNSSHNFRIACDKLRRWYGRVCCQSTTTKLIFSDRFWRSIQSSVAEDPQKNKNKSKSIGDKPFSDRFGLVTEWCPLKNARPSLCTPTFCFRLAKQKKSTQAIRRTPWPMQPIHRSSPWSSRSPTTLSFSSPLSSTTDHPIVLDLLLSARPPTLLQQISNQQKSL